MIFTKYTLIGLLSVAVVIYLLSLINILIAMKRKNRSSLGLVIIQPGLVGIIERAGRYVRVRRGRIWYIPVLEVVHIRDTRAIVCDLEPQVVITGEDENITIKVDGFVLYRIISAVKMLVRVKDIDTTLTELFKAALRDTIGVMRLGDILAKREEINKKLHEAIDSSLSDWGIELIKVALQNIILPDEVRNAYNARYAATQDRGRLEELGGKGDKNVKDWKTLEVAEKLAEKGNVRVITGGVGDLTGLFKTASVIKEGLEEESGKEDKDAS